MDEKSRGSIFRLNGIPDRRKKKIADFLKIIFLKQEKNNIR